MARLGLPLARSGHTAASQNSLTHGRDLTQGAGQPAERPEPRPSRNWPSPNPPSSPRFHAPDGSALPRPTPTTHPPSIGRRRPQRSVSSDRPRDRVPFVGERSVELSAYRY